MRYSAVALAALASGAAAARPANMSICDYYTMALLGDTSAEHEATVLTLLVNTVVIGNYTKPTIPNVTFPDVMVPGILANGTYNGTKVNLLPYFDGGLASSNRGGMTGVAVNFLDDGGATPLLANKPADGTTSNQYKLLTHLYQFFGALLGCSSQMAGGAFSTYQGQPSMYAVHKFMDLSEAEFGYFVQQVALAAESFGVAMDDITAVGKALNGAFGMSCSAAATIIPSQGAQLQAICVGEGCPLATNATTSSCPYSAPFMPGVANATLAMGEGNTSLPVTTMSGSATAASTMASSTGTMMASGTATPSSSGAGVRTYGSAAAFGLAAVAFLL